MDPIFRTLAVILVSDVCVCVTVSVCVCVCERERERETVCQCVCARARTCVYTFKGMELRWLNVDVAGHFIVSLSLTVSVSLPYSPNILLFLWK